MNKKGFTLIEVVVTVVIVAVLAGIAATSYTAQKRRAEYNGARGTVMALAAAVKNQFYMMGGFSPIVLTGNTAATNTQYKLALKDRNFWNFRVTAGAPFEISVEYAPRGALGFFATTETYTFDANGTQTNCAGTNCITP